MGMAHRRREGPIINNKVGRDGGARQEGDLGHLWDKIPLGLSKGSSPDPSKPPGWEGLHCKWDGAVQRSSRCFQSTATLLWDKGLDEFPGASRRVSLVPWKQTLLEQAPAARSLLHFTATPPKQPVLWVWSHFGVICF